MDIERIRLLSTRFHSLQGLRLALAGASLATVVGGYLIATPQPTNDGAMIAMGASVVLFLAGMPSLNRYYADNFGRQVWRRPGYLPHVPLIMIPYWVVAMYLNAKFPEIPAGTPTLVTVALVSIAITVRDWPWRAYYLGAAAAVGIGFAGSASVTGLIAPNMTLGAIFFLLGTSLVPIGVLDHLLLVKLMKETRQPAQQYNRE